MVVFSRNWIGRAIEIWSLVTPGAVAPPLSRLGSK